MVRVMTGNAEDDPLAHSGCFDANLNTPVLYVIHAPGMMHLNRNIIGTTGFADLCLQAVNNV